MYRKASYVVEPEKIFDVGRDVVEVLIISTILASQHNFRFNTVVRSLDGAIVGIKGLDIASDDPVVRSTMYFLATWFGIYGRDGAMLFQLLRRCTALRVESRNGFLKVYYSL